MLENVKNLVGKKFKSQFQEWLEWLDSIGYNTYWQVLNAKNYGVPQNRERVFAISIRKDIDTGDFKFPEPFDNGKRLKDVLESEVDEKYYLSDKLVQGFARHNERHEAKGTGFLWKPRDVDGNASALRANGALAPKDNTIVAGSLNHYGNDQMNRVYSPEGNSPTITTVSGGGREQKIIEPYAYGALVQPVDRDYNKHGGKREERVEVFDEPVSYALRANNHGALVAINEPVICASRGRNPENPSDRTAGAPTEQRLEFNTNGTSNTITTVQKDNYVCEAILQRGHGYNAGGVKADCPTITGNGTFPQNNFVINPSFRIRKLTPRECWRLMGFTDEAFEAAKYYSKEEAAELLRKYPKHKGKRQFSEEQRIERISDSQLYKQAGNSIVVDVLYYIFKSLFRGKNHQPYEQLTLDNYE